MIRVAIIADSHFDSAPGGRFEECARVHSWIVDDLARRGVDLVMHSGDVFERRSTPEERRAFAAWVQAVTDLAPLVIVRGNHDALGDLPLFAKLETKHPVYVEEQVGVYIVGGCTVACLAWPSKASILALGAKSHAEGELLAGEALRNVLRGLGQEMDGFNCGEPRILLAHAMVRGSVTSVGQPLVGCDLELGIEDLGLCRADFVALGHIHKGQDWTHDAPIVYPGSPRRTSFGEVERKGYVLATFDDATGKLQGWELIETPCAPMLLLECEYGSEPIVSGSDQLDALGFYYSSGRDGLPNVSGAEVRLRYRVAADERAAASAAADAFKAKLMAAGAVNVKLDPQVIASGTARAPQVALARTTADKLAALWKTRGNAPDAGRCERLFAKVTSLETEHAG